MQNRLTLRLSWPVSEFLLPDLRALLPAESIQFFSNELDEQWHYTLLCIPGDKNCSLIVSAILVWRQLGRIHALHYSSAAVTTEATHASQEQLFGLLNTPGAVVNIS
ncbi:MULTISPECIES: hypothetical protein [Winslowiella]|uniref:hypothetical protein n=1 Tax=Winslowiella TaxID=2997349 RepID=UPI0028BEA722|nr:hypothetical protein [Winslowiella toletana]WNN46091.1 hypothetical protein RIN69_09655 [Winslowiella toletana]